MALILWVIDRPSVPTWVVVVGFLGPVTLLHWGGLLYPAAGTIYRSFQVTQMALGPDGKPIINPTDRPEVRPNSRSAWTTTSRSSPTRASRRS